MVRGMKVGIFFGHFFFFCLVDTRCYVNFRCTAQGFTDSIHYAMLTASEEGVFSAFKG